MTDLAVSATGLERSFGSTKAVDGVDLAVARGEIYGFLGPNGAGKSTMVRMLCTLLGPTGGSASVAGFDVSSQADEVRLRIGVALQEASLDAKQTGREVLDMQGRMYGIKGQTLQRRIAEVVEFVDIGSAIDDMVDTYSGGMKRRVDLATALLHEPEVLFLDEPTTGLDPASRAKVWEEVSRLRDDLGITIFLTTQYLEEADALADRVGIIDAGRLAVEGTPEALKRSVGADLIIVQVSESSERLVDQLRQLHDVSDVQAHEGEITVSSTDGAAVINDLVVELNNAGVRAESLTLRTPTLDDVFLQVTGSRLSVDGGIQVDGGTQADGTIEGDPT